MATASIANLTKSSRTTANKNNNNFTSVTNRQSLYQTKGRTLHHSTPYLNILRPEHNFFKLDYSYPIPTLFKRLLARSTRPNKHVFRSRLYHDKPLDRAANNNNNNDKLAKLDSLDNNIAIANL
ncbi:hypothetical protein BGZ47_009668 [Haplosporangium gracile]|nr:hypothetical protein BGZ47_009668 [Haplosporangium gracile]